MLNKKHCSAPPGGKRIGLLLLTPIMAAMLAVSADATSAVKASISAKTKFDLNGQLIITGATKGLSPGSQVTVSDAASNQILYSIKTNGKGLFNISVPVDQATLCKIKVESGAAISIIGVSKNKSCSTVPSCVIANGDQKINVGGSVNLSILASKTAKTDPLQFSWNVSNTGPTLPANNTVIAPTGTGNTLAHTFNSPGLYRVALNGNNSAGSCHDSITVSVAPSSSLVPTTVDGLVSAAKSATPDTASTLNAPTGSYVVLPFEDMGMQGGSQINLPVNPMIPYNALNAQVLVKEAHKPKLRTDSEVAVQYSAAVNANDPVGSDSINSTSQNWFSDQSAGSNINFDPTKTTIDPSSLGPINNTFNPGHDFADAVIRKTEQWDRQYEKNAKHRSNTSQTSIDMAWQQNRFTPAQPLAQPDEGIRGNLDLGAKTRDMPGISAPYAANIPQDTVYNSGQSAFIAQFIPASNVDDKGRTNPYPLMRVEAKDVVTDKTLAKVDTVYTTASETRCRECHLPGGVAADADVWRTPVSEADLTLPDGVTPGPATGAGSYGPGLDASKAWPPAVHNHFDDTVPGKPSFTNLIAGYKTLPDENGNPVTRFDKNNRRTDRVSDSRWVKLDASGNPDPSQISTDAYAGFADEATAHANGWRIQFKIKFKSAADYGDPNDPVLQEKAALFNVFVMHDYMAFYGPTPAAGSTWPAGYSVMLADAFTEEDTGPSGSRPQYYCSGHHQSQLKFDVGIAAKAAPTNRSDYSRAFHAFHGKMQTYKEDVTAAASVDGKDHKVGELIRDKRGHPLMYGGRGWDSQQDDDNGIPLKMQTTTDTDGNTIAATPAFVDTTVTKVKGTDYTKWDSKYFTVPTWDPAKNNWRPDLFPMHEKGQLMLQFGSKVAMEDNCVTCHTGKTEKSYRDIHHARGLTCDSCHSDMLAVGNVFPNEDYDANLTWAGAFGKDTNNGYATADPTKGDAEALKVAVTNLGISEPADFRRPWLDMPDCGSCHIGDANDKAANMPGKLFSAGTLKQAWVDGDKSGKSLTPMNARFAVMPTNSEQRLEKYTYTATDPDVVSGKTKAGDTTYKPQPLSTALYRKSGDVHGSGGNGTLTCSTCHGGSHAIWPNPDPNANDNVTAKQLQGYDGNISECSVCHIKDDFKTGRVSTDGGGSGLGVAQGVRQNSNTDLTAPNITDTAQKSFLAGPHGLHPVNDESWWKDVAPDNKGNSLIHADAFKSKVIADPATKRVINGGWHSEMTYKPGPDGEDQCAACHGADHMGTRLSKTLTARDFVTDKGKKIHVEAGTVIGCNLCHLVDVSFARQDPKDAKSARKTWSAPKMHMPPMTMEPDPVPAGGKSGMNMNM